jgi:hypothetical protein
LERHITVEPSVDFKSLQFVTVLLETGDELQRRGKKK